MPGLHIAAITLEQMCRLFYLKRANGREQTTPTEPKKCPTIAHVKEKK